MSPIVIGLLFTSAVFAQSPAEHALNLNTLGNQTSEAGDYMGATRLYREALEIWESLGSAYDGHRAGSLLNLGTSLCGAGHRAEGAAAYEEALALHRRTLGPRNERTVSNMNLLASDYLMLGELDKAEALLNEVLPIVRADFPNEIHCARSLQVLSGVLTRHGKLHEALAPAEEALNIIIRCAGDDSLEAALGYASVAETHRTAGEIDRALPLYRKAHALYEKRLGPNHPRVAAVMSQEGLIAMLDGKLSTAEQLMLQSVSILNQSCPDCVVELAVAENNLGLLRLKQKRYKQADEVLTHALALREKFSPRPTTELASSLQSLALARKMEHRDADAASLNRRAATILEFR